MAKFLFTTLQARTTLVGAINFSCLKIVILSVDILPMLLARGAEPDAQDKYGHSPLHRAASKGYDKAIEMMIQVMGVYNINFILVLQPGA